MAEASDLEVDKNPRINFTDERLCVIQVLGVFISFVTILADLTTDVLVIVEYCKDLRYCWALGSLIFIMTPNLLTNIFSLRWILIDNKLNIHHWLTHLLLLGQTERYLLFFREVFSCPSLENITTQKLMSKRNELHLLHFLYIFVGTIPQIILQSYAIIILDENHNTKALSLCAAITSMIWGLTSYIHTSSSIYNGNFTWEQLVLKLVWHFSILTARIWGILLFTVIFGIWLLVPMGFHWTAMTFWIITQKTTFCPNKLEETLYNVVMGLVYCFCFVNLREGQTRNFLIMFNIFMLSQNFGSLFLYVLLSDKESQRKVWSITATTSIITGTIIGICAMALYYRYFHSQGPIPWKRTNQDTELNNKKSTNNESHTQSHDFYHVRLFKTSPKTSTTKDEIKDSIQWKSTEKDGNNLDKNFLLEHWITRSGTPTINSSNIDNSMDVSSIQIHTVENTPQTVCLQNKVSSTSITYNTGKTCQKDLMLKLTSINNIESSIDDISLSYMNLKKRRGICSSDELNEDIINFNLSACIENVAKNIKLCHSSESSSNTERSNKKTSSDSIDLDLDLSLSDINSSDINTFNENIVQKLCLSALKNIKVGNQDADIENIQKIALDILKEMYSKKGKKNSSLQNNALLFKQRDLDTPTEVLSVHDYENICAVNIAREAWGLRSWNGYCDIENWLHDGSVNHDRRRDTLTSGSSEISSCLSQDLKNAILTAPSLPKKVPTYSNIFVRFDRSSQEDYTENATFQNIDETYLAKPCLIENIRDPNHLEPILEELDDLVDIDTCNKQKLNSESSLVATIDEIRKSTVTNSPTLCYHSRNSRFLPHLSENSEIDLNLKRALWKEPSKFDSNNTMQVFPEKENVLQDLNVIITLPEKGLNPSTTKNTTLYHEYKVLPNSIKNVKRRPKPNSSIYKTNTKKSNLKIDHHLQEITNNDIDFLWQLVSESSKAQTSSYDLSSNHLTSSLQSLVHKERLSQNTSVKITNIKKGTKGKPKRKFSVLKEKFEPRINTNSDEEILYNTTNVPHKRVGSKILKNKYDSNIAASNYLTLEQNLTK